MPRKLERTLSFFSKLDEGLVGEYPLDGVSLDALRSLFGVDAGDPMYEIYPVGPAQMGRLRAMINQPIDLSKYDYFVECSEILESPGSAVFDDESRMTSTAS